MALAPAAAPCRLTVSGRTRPNSSAAVAGALVIAGLALAGCGGASAHAGRPTATTTRDERPSHIFAAPAGTVGSGAPQPNGTMWLLVRTSKATNIQALDLSTGKITAAVGVSASASSVTELSTGVVAVGTATARAGSVELRNGTTGALARSIPVSGPVRALAAGANGTTLYALVGTAHAEAVEILDTSNGKRTGTIPVSTGSVAVTASPTGSDVYVLGASGDVTDYPAAGGSAASSFPVGAQGVSLAISPDGTTLYVLKGPATSRNVAVVDVATESVEKVLPAPANAEQVVVSADGRTLYDAVGTPSYGNVQAYGLG